MTLAQMMKRGVVAVLLTLALVLQATGSVLAGTTGVITGSVVDASTNQPIAGARVTVASPSQTATATTDGSGRYTFASLVPDTYTVSIPAVGIHDAYSVSGVTVQADNTQTVTIPAPRKLSQIGSVTSRAASALVKPGTTADVYSISATQQDKASQLGGGGTLNSAWSAISSVPGVFVPSGQNGYIGAGPGVSIRGGDYNQIGYELDGIPVNRSFDNYPSSVLSSLGQQEVQVYTGATPANSEANGLSGYINQVIRTGTAPAYKNLTLAVGSPTFYNKVSFETGGATPSRTFSYYFGAGAYNQDFRYFDNFNGASLQNLYGTPMAPCGAGKLAYTPANYPSCFSPTGQDYSNGGASNSLAYVLGNPAAFGQASQQERDTVLNLHFGLPQKSGTKDDIQVLYDNSNLRNQGYDSPNDLGGASYLNNIGYGTPHYADSNQITVPYGTVFAPGFAGGVPGTSVPYYFPFSPVGRPAGAAIGSNTRDEYVNDQSIIKLQYQKNFGTNAFLRVYGYTYYSDWLNNGPNSYYSALGGFGFAYDSYDYELNAHSRGVSATFSDQINSQNLLTLQGSFTTANSTRYNNSGINFSPSTKVAYLVNGNNPYNGTCYSLAGAADVGCNYGSSPYASATLTQFINGTIPQPTAASCGGGPCQYVLVAGGPSATYNTVKPAFSSFSITDDFRPTDKLDINLGLRYDQFKFTGSDTTNSGARTLFYNAYDATHTLQLVNVSGAIQTYNELQPRVGLTYTIDPRTVVRASYGRYAQAPNTAFEQYNYLQPNDLSNLIKFASHGLESTPSHNVRPEVSNNYDFSLERQFGRDTSVKITPFLRKTQDQIQQFYIDQPTNFVSGLNVGRQTSQGVEFELDKGDFARNGFAGRFTFTYTNSTIKYSSLPNGTTIVDPINGAIKNYNAYTSFCASNPKDARCAGGSTTTGVTAAPCYTASTYDAKGNLLTSGQPTACGAGTVANPYWNAPVQALLDPNGSYPTFDSFPGSFGSSLGSYGAPYVATVLVQYKHGPLSVTPALQFSAGQRYGIPQNTPGVEPDTCAALGNAATSDPRYGYGAAGGSGYDATTCGSGLTDNAFAIPDPYTGHFDAIGQYLQPNIAILHTQVSYDVSKRLTLVGTFSNLWHACWGGTAPQKNTSACSYSYPLGGLVPWQGNVVNPGQAVQPAVSTPYIPAFGSYPFNMYIEARLKI